MMAWDKMCALNLPFPREVSITDSITYPGVGSHMTPKQNLEMNNIWAPKRTMEKGKITYNEYIKIFSH